MKNETMLVIERDLSVQCYDYNLLSVSASRGPVFRRNSLNGQIDQNETWAQGVSAHDLIVRNILL